MNGNSILSILKTMIQGKATAFFTRIRLWTSWTYVRGKLVSLVQSLFGKVLNVKPRHKKDYYEAFGWLVSKRLARAIVVVVALVSGFFLVNHYLSGTHGTGEVKIKKYSYNSVLLRFAEGEVQITGKGGYLAYEGEVRKGYVTGQGRLYNRDGALVYQGAFSQNCYSGAGTQYYNEGTLKYQGDFANNLYEGIGKLYRDNGSLWYEGSFARGMKEGEGVLYDGSAGKVYSGNFSNDRIVYSDFLGKTTQKMGEAYTGSRILYEDDDYFVVVMKDINAVYMGEQTVGTMDDAVTVDTVYVLENNFPVGGQEYRTISELQNYFGRQDYEGWSLITMPETVCYSQVSRNNTYELDTIHNYDDYYTVTGYASEKEVYLCSFEKNGLVYSFVSKDGDGTFDYYSITKAEENA